MAMEREGSQEIALALDPGNEDGTVSALRHAADDPGGPWQPAMIGTLLGKTTSNRVRNAAAVALADLNAPEGATLIAAQVARPEVAAASGTLLYALDRLGAALPLDAFLTVIEHGSFEARAEALELLHADRVDLTEVRDPGAVLNRLESVLVSGSGDAVDAAAESLTVLAPRLSGPSFGPRP